MISATTFDSPACEDQLFVATAGTQTRINRHQPCNRDNIEYIFISFVAITDCLRHYISALNRAASSATLRLRRSKIQLHTIWPGKSTTVLITQEIPALG
jgi:hypothetical protein